MPRFIRDDENAWATATPAKRLLGLVLGIAVSLVLISPIVLLIYFIVLR
jgi:hypothetical protein